MASEYSPIPSVPNNLATNITDTNWRNAEKSCLPKVASIFSVNFLLLKLFCLSLKNIVQLDRRISGSDGIFPKFNYLVKIHLYNPNNFHAFRIPEYEDFECSLH